jgi:hypothetical protein
MNTQDRTDRTPTAADSTAGDVQNADLGDLTQHGMNCPATNPTDKDMCRCGLQWRIALATERTMHAAWRKRAEQAEKEARTLRMAYEGDYF